MKLLSLGLALLALPSSVFAADWKCGTIDPAFAPYYEGPKYFVGLITVCDIKNTAHSGFLSLNDYFLARIGQTHVVEGPTSQKFLELDGQHWVTDDRFDQNGAPMAVVNDTYIATDLQTRLVDAAYSRSVQGTGDADKVRYIDFVIDVRAGAAAGEFKVYLTGKIGVEKPWFIPGGVFEGPVRDSANSTMAGQRDWLLPEIANAL